MPPGCIVIDQNLVMGFNHDVPYSGKVYHVQTEQVARGHDCHIVTAVYSEGRVIGGHRAVWDGSLEDDEGRKRLATQVRYQHKSAIQCILVGKLSLLEAKLVGEPSVRARRAEAAGEEEPPWAPKLRKVRPSPSATQDLAARRDMIRFVRAVGEAPPKHPEGIRDRLRSIGTTIAVLLGKEGERHLRQDDLAELVMKRSEAAVYLRRHDPGDLEVGRSLWQSFAALARSFAPINDRAAIRAHDREIFGRLVARWMALEDRDQPPSPLDFELLKSCWGRDEKLDKRLEDLRGLTIERLLPELARVTVELEGSGEAKSNDESHRRD